MQANFSQQDIVKQVLFQILVVMVFIYGLAPGVLNAGQKVSEDLFSVSFPNEKQGWVCGSWGNILHTNDGGLTWSPQNSGTDFTLSSVYFVDTFNGWAVGDEGTIIHTLDGGMTWESQKCPVPFFLMDTYFATPLKGWIVTEQTHILTTDDGGKTWRVQFRDQDFILKAISFADSYHGWTVGEYGCIYHTDNGGSTWVKQSGYFNLSEETGEVEGGTFLFDAVAVDSMTAWAVGIDGYVIKTENGGNTWLEVNVSAPKTQLFCIASDRANKMMIGGNGVFLSSTDMGRTWKNPAFEPPITYGWIYGLANRGSSGFVAVGWEGAIYLSDSSSWYSMSY